MGDGVAILNRGSLVVFAAGLATGWAIARYAPVLATASAEWGTVGEWVGGLATAGALAVAGFQVRELRRSEERADLRQRRAAARSVTAVANLIEVRPAPRLEVRLRNTSDTPVFQAVCIVFSDAKHPVAQLRIGTVAGGTDSTLTPQTDPKALQWTTAPSRLRTELRFVDAYGTTWKALDDNLSELRDDS